MIIGIKDSMKLVGIFIIVFCAVLVCAMFSNFIIDIGKIRQHIVTEEQLATYNAQKSLAIVVCLVSGMCLLITSVVMLFFYIKHYIDTHKKELGILKALGHSNLQIAKHFWVFGMCVFLGGIVGFASSYLIMPLYYQFQNKGNILPKISMGFHPILLLYFVIIPTVFFCFLAIFYALLKLKMPVFTLLKDMEKNSPSVKKERNNKERLFIEEMRKTTLRSRKTLVFFIIFASFCFSAMTQMSIGMKEYSSIMMGMMILIIGLILACTTVFLAITTVIRGNVKTIAMMKVFGYSQKECCSALLSGYRPLAYVGFLLGTIYQYVLMKVMIEVVFKDVGDMMKYNFDFLALFISLAAFIVLYEFVIYFYSKKMEKISVKQIMLE